ncbi:MAG: hypothetical protein Q7J34_01200 [Bacteroidales bacterium]|jgi:hypothetical protein|nr:hypothetical protein [Bacteroidales bacterium]
MNTKTYLYFSMTPESLIASMLPPEEFGHYLAVGTNKRTRGQALFFEIDPEFESDYFDLESIKRRCVPHVDGKPKRSVYLSTYRVLENIPMSNFRSLFLVTFDGNTLELKSGDYVDDIIPTLHLYQEVSPVPPRVASKLAPRQFMSYVTQKSNPVSFPKIVFTELLLDGMADNPSTAPSGNLPYSNKDHLRDCLIGLHMGYEKPNKTVERFFQGDFLFRTVKNGFFVGDQDNFIYYPFPSVADLQKVYYPWWRSALNLEFSEKKNL